MKVKDRLVLFKGECAICHTKKGIGKVGDELFLADCAMCHGIDAKGKVNIGPSLIGKDYARPGVISHIRAIITDGSKTNPEMPPFHARHGGPLNDFEIDSLVRYLTFKSKQSKVSSQ